MQLPVDLVQEILLDNLVHDDGDEEIEKDGGHVLDAGGVHDRLSQVGRSALGRRRRRHVVVQGDEKAGHRRRHLEH